MYYDFRISGNGSRMIGPCEFIHKRFCCPTCLEQMEYVTQTSFEDVDLFLAKLKKKFLKRGIPLEIKKQYETKEGTAVDRIEHIENIKKLCLSVRIENRELLTYELPLLRKRVYERPHYFKMPARKF